LADLIGEEQIDWKNFTVTDPNAPEYEGPPVAEESPEADPAAADTPADEPIATEDTAQQERPREVDPLSGDPPLDRDDDTVAPEQTGDPLVDAYLAKYGGDMEQAVRAAAHQAELIGRQGVELGEMRQQMSDLVEAVNRPPVPSLDNLGEIFVEDPFLAAETTLEVGVRTGDWGAHNAVISQWKEIDPAQVRLYENQKRIELTIQQDREERQRSTQQAAAAPQQMEVLSSAEQRFRGEFPDVDLSRLQQPMIDEAVEASRVAGRNVYSDLMESGDPEQVYHGFRTLALAALNRSGAAQRQQVSENARTAAVETQRAKAAAMVTSANASAADPAPPKTFDDELLEEFEQQDKRRSGFNIGNY
jgi:hypothetical protein